MQFHGGDLDRVRDAYGGARWLDLSTGINPVAYPVKDLPAQCWSVLPERQSLAQLEAVAAESYGASIDQVVPLAGAQGAIQLMPRLARAGLARVLGPTYSEHAKSLQAQGWTVETVYEFAALQGADLAVVVNPNNPDGCLYQPANLVALSKTVGLLVVDESFADPLPGLSVVPELGQNMVVLRSFGKFYGLAGVRLGFAIAHPDLCQSIRALAGPWAVNGPAVALGTRALADKSWQEATCLRLNRDADRLDTIALAKGWTLVGGTPLFRTYACGPAGEVQDRLAKQQVWTRIFDYAPQWIRFGLPGDAADWLHLERSFTAIQPL